MKHEPNLAEVSRILGNMSTCPGFTTTTDRATAKRVLESDFVFCQGELCDITVKHRGLGVYAVSAVKR